MKVARRWDFICPPSGSRRWRDVTQGVDCRRVNESTAEFARSRRDAFIAESSPENRQIVRALVTHDEVPPQSHD